MCRGEKVTRLVHIAVATVDGNHVMWTLKTVLSPINKHRQAVCHFRTNNTIIPKVIGRYKHIDISLWVCNVCVHKK